MQLTNKTISELMQQMKFILSKHDIEMAEFYNTVPDLIKQHLGMDYKDQKLAYPMSEAMLDAEHRLCQSLNYDSDGTLGLSDFNKKSIKDIAHFVIEQANNYITKHFKTDSRRKSLVKEFLSGIVHKDDLYVGMKPYATNFDLIDQFGLCPEKVGFEIRKTFLRIYTNVDYKMFNLAPETEFDTSKNEYALIRNCIYEESTWEEFCADVLHCVFVTLKIA